MHPWHYMAAARCLVLLAHAQSHQLRCGIEDRPLQKICSCLLQDLGKTCAHSFCLAFAIHGRQAILPPTFGFVTCARTASPCFTRPRSELGLSSRAPQVSAPGVQLLCSIKSRVFSFMRHHVLNVGRPRHTCRHHRLNQWSSRLVSSMTRLHPSSVGTESS